MIEKRIEIENQYETYKKKIELRRTRKWKRIEEKQGIHQFQILVYHKEQKTQKNSLQ